MAVKMNDGKINIVLVNSPFSLKENFGLLDFVGQYGPPLNLLYLAAVLEEANINTKILDLSSETKSLEECAEYIVSLNPEVVGVSVHFTFLVNKSLRLISLIKKFNPKINIIVGGSHFTAVPEETMDKCPGIDVGVLGEAESVMVEVVGRLNGDKDLTGINGVIFRNENRLIKIGSNNLVDDINKLPFPPFSKIDTDAYSLALYKEKRKINFPILTSRGCSFACTFCDRTVHGRRIRFHSVEYLSKMIDTLVREFKLDCLDIEDENICITEDRFKDICELMRDKLLKYNITWGCSMRLDSVNSHTGKRLYDAGCRNVTFGIESGSQRMLNVYDKKMNMDQAEIYNRCKLIRDAGISVLASFIIGGPEEDMESISATIDLLRKIDLDYMYVWYFSPYPGSEIYKDIKSKGTLIGDYSGRTGQYISFIPHTMSRRQLEAGYKKIFQMFYSRPRVIIRMMQRYKFNEISRLFKDGCKYIYRFILRQRKENWDFL